MGSITVIVNTYNEERRLGLALRSVMYWADEVIVVDMYSNDGTAEVAKKLGAQVILHRGTGKPYPPREFSVQQGTGEWILMLDADEMLPVGLAEELRRLSLRTDVDVVLLPRLNYFFGIPVLNSGCDPDRDACPRFFRRGHVLGSSKTHKDFAVPPGSRALKLPYRPGVGLVHFTYLDGTDVLEKFNRYTTLESEECLHEGIGIPPHKMLYLAIKEFFWRYLKCRGYRDGWCGLYISLLYAFYRVCTCLKLHQLRSVGDRQQVEQLYHHEALRLLQQWDEKTREVTGFRCRSLDRLTTFH